MLDLFLELLAVTNNCFYHLQLRLICYAGCERDKTFYLNSKIKSIIATNELTAHHQSFVNISKPAHMWNWLINDLGDILFTEHACNLGSSIIIGNATRIKQVRLKL